jgi:hypothetical protein
MFKTPIEWLKEMITQLVKDFADAAFSWLKVFMIEPTDFEKYGFVAEMYNIVFALSVTIGGLFFAYNLIKLVWQKMGGYESRSVSEVTVKAIMGTVLGALAPFLMKEVLLKLNNIIVEMFVAKGVTVKTLSALVLLPQNASLAAAFATLFLAGIFLIMSIQYIIRLAEIMVLYMYSPLAAISSVNEDMNAWSIWWREAFATVFTQAFQMSILWLVINQIAGGQELKDVILACGLMILVLKGPGFLRKFLYSTGAGRTIVGTAGGAGKMAIYKFAASKMIK